MPTRVQNRNTGLDYHDIIRVIGVADPIDIRAGKHGIHFAEAWRNTVKCDANQLGVLRHDSLGEHLRKDLRGRWRPIPIRAPTSRYAEGH